MYYGTIEILEKNREVRLFMRIKYIISFLVILRRVRSIIMNFYGIYCFLFG